MDAENKRRIKRKKLKNDSLIDTMLLPIEIQFYKERLAIFDDKDAYKELFTHFYEKLRRFAMGIIKVEVTTEDIVSDVFLTLWQNRAKLTDVENLNAYLYTITKNLSLKYLSKDRNIAQFSINDININHPKIENNPEDILLNKEVISRIEHAIESLPPKCKLIYRLVRYEKLRYKEIASVLNISVKTIDAQMAIATKKIAQSIQFVFPS